MRDLDDARSRGRFLDAPSDFEPLVRVHEVHLVDRHDVGARDLGSGQVGHLSPQTREALHIDDGEGGAQREERPKLRLQERVQHRNGVRHAAQLDEHVLGGLGSSQQTETGVGQILADRAADAPVGETDRLALDTHHEPGVDVHGTEVIDEHRGPHSVARGQDVIEQRRLAGAEEPAKDRDGDRRRPGALVCHAAPPAP